MQCVNPHIETLLSSGVHTLPVCNASSFIANTLTNAIYRPVNELPRLFVEYFYDVAVYAEIAPNRLKLQRDHRDRTLIVIFHT